MRKELENLVLALKEAFNISAFIETGTWKAQTTTWASLNFEKVVTIEADNGYYERAKGLGLLNTRFILGDSATELPKVVKRLKQPAIFWLDAHKCNDRPAIETSECPLLAELESIKASGLPHLILIDDARYFIGRPEYPHDPTQWPTMEQVKAALPVGYEAVVWQAAIVAVSAEAMPIVKRFVDPQKMEVVVLTSNAYLHCLPPFAYLFNKFWSINQPVKVARYEHRPRHLPTNFSNFAIGNQADYTWSSGLMKYLQYHNGELILLMLEDYFLDSSAHQPNIKMAWDYMLQHSEVAKIDLTNDRLKVAHSDYDAIFIQSANDAPFLTSLQAAIWRKDFLLKALNPDESPWQFEKRGTKRVMKEKPLILGFRQPPMSYVNAIGGEGGNPSAWDTKKIPQWVMSELKGRGLI